MIPKLKYLMQFYPLGEDKIYGKPITVSKDQLIEIKLRKIVARIKTQNYLDMIRRSHSIPVMDHEVEIFLKKIPKNGLILDIGGCWGWHWRNIDHKRNDVGIVIIDFVRSNLPHALNILGSNVNKQIVLMHADATKLPFKINSKFKGFDGVWTVQTFQHIPNYEKAVREAYRVLKKKGIFINYSLNIQPHIAFIKSILGRDYLAEGWVKGSYWLARASIKQKQQIEMIFKSRVFERWTEILYSPEMHFYSPGKEGSLLGKIDSLLSNNYGFLGWIARQKSFFCQKK